ncbi:hypothetical protein DKX38_019465 [Salix brachista]|uniref:Uncharacterized protein n=1 Tax=Salix brachista TaxID=2182728 RepID=A0A5N5KGF8_9ROSI|nr:hypothetical protein DKX38_019465 [Salix brachista]
MANNVARAIVAALDWNSTPDARKAAVSFLGSVSTMQDFIDSRFSTIQTWSGPLVDPASAGAPRRKKKNTGDTREPSKLPTGKDKSRDTRLKGKKSMA